MSERKSNQIARRFWIVLFVCLVGGVVGMVFHFQTYISIIGAALLASFMIPWVQKRFPDEADNDVQDT